MIEENNIKSMLKSEETGYENSLSDRIKDDNTDKKKTDKEKSLGKEIFEWVYCIFIAIILALLFRYYVGTPTTVQQQSMKETLMPGERLLLNKWAITTGAEFKRGEIVTFESPSNSYISLQEYDRNNPVAVYDQNIKGINNFIYYVLEIGKESYIKRIIGLPGDSIKIYNGKVYLNGEELKEDYLNGKITTSLEGLFTDIIVPEGHLYVMGDNRPESTDSRRFGCIPIEKIESKLLTRVWPFDKWGKVE